jgi:hypothetical protein
MSDNVKAGSYVSGKTDVPLLTIGHPAAISFDTRTQYEVNRLRGGGGGANEHSLPGTSHPVSAMKGTRDDDKKSTRGYLLPDSVYQSIPRKNTSRLKRTTLFRRPTIIALMVHLERPLYKSKVQSHLSSP